MVYNIHRREKRYFSPLKEIHFITLNDLYYDYGGIGNTVSMKSIQSTYLKQISHQPINSNNGNNNCNYN